MMSKKGIGMLTMLLIVALICFAIIASSLGQSIYSAITAFTKGVEPPGSLDEETMHAMILRHIESERYSDARDLAREFIDAYDAKEFDDPDMIHDVYYMKFYSHVMLTEFDQAMDTLVTYIGEFTEITKQEPASGPSRVLFNAANDIKEGDYSNAYGKFEGMFDLPADYINEHVPYHRIGILSWPKLSDEVKTSLGLNPFLFNLYWVVKLRVRISGCNDQEFLSQVLGTVLYSFSEASNDEFVGSAYRVIKSICTKEFNHVSYEYLMEALSDPQIIHEQQGQTFDYEKLFTISDGYAKLDDDFKLPGEYAKLVRALSAMEEIRVMPLDYPQTYEERNDFLTNYGLKISAIREKAPMGVKELNELGLESSLYNTYVYIISGFIQVEVLMKDVRELCNMPKGNGWNDLFSLKGDLTKFMHEYMNGAFAALYRSLYQEQHNVYFCSYPFRQAFWSRRMFRLANQSLENPQREIIVSYYDGENVKTRTLTQEDKEKLLLYILPYYIQSDFIFHSDDAQRHNNYLFILQLLRGLRSRYCRDKIIIVPKDNILDTEVQTCGNGIVEGSEICDEGLLWGTAIGTDLNDLSTNLICPGECIRPFEEGQCTCPLDPALLNPITGNTIINPEDIDIYKCNNDGKKQPGEQCDGGISGIDPINCDIHDKCIECECVYSPKTQGYCGDGIKQKNEECDKTDVLDCKGYGGDERPGCTDDCRCIPPGYTTAKVLDCGGRLSTSFPGFDDNAQEFFDFVDLVTDHFIHYNCPSSYDYNRENMYFLCFEDGNKELKQGDYLRDFLYAYESKIEKFEDGK